MVTTSASATSLTNSASSHIAHLQLICHGEDRAHHLHCFGLVDLGKLGLSAIPTRIRIRIRNRVRAHPQPFRLSVETNLRRFVLASIQLDEDLTLLGLV